MSDILFNIVSDNIDALVGVIDRNGKLSYANAALKNAVGSKRVENGKEFVTLIHPDEREQVQLFLRDAVQNTSTFDVNVRLIVEDGSECRIRLNGIAQYDQASASHSVVVIANLIDRNNAGERIEVVSQTKNVSKRFQTEEQQKESSNRLELTLDNLNIIAFELDRHGTFLLSRGRGLEKLGLKPDQIVGQSIYDIYKDQHTILDALDKALHGATTSFEVEVEEIVWQTNYVPIRDSQGVIERVFGTAIDITERKGAEEGLRYETDLWHSLMNNIPDTIYFKDIHSRFTRINKAQAELIGVKEAHEVIGKTDADYFPPEYAAQTLADERHIVTTGDPVLGKIEKYVADDGRLRWFSTTKVPIRSKKGGVVGIVGSSREITELKQAEILESALYRIAEKTTSSGGMENFYFFIHTTISELMYAKNFYIALFDPEKNMLSYPYFVDECDEHPSPEPLGSGLTAYVLRTGKSLLCDERRSEELHRLGEAELVGAPCPVWLGVPLIAEKTTIGVMVVQHYSDPRMFTERELHILEFVSSQAAKAIEHKRAAEALRASQSELVALFASMNDAIIVFDREGRYMKIAPTNPSLLYRPPNELIGKTLHEVFPKEKADFFLDAVQNALKSAGSIHIEYQLELKDSPAWFAAVISPMDEHAVVWVARDVTERKKLEDQLRQAQKMEGIGTLAGGIAHDFNNLLGIILGYATLLETSSHDSARTEQSIEAIKQAVQRGADLVRQLLTFARKSDPTFASVNVNEMIVELSKMLSQTFPRTIDLELHLAESLPDIIADSTQLHQAFLNLCVNARDAMVDESSGNTEKGTLTLSSNLVSGKQLHEKFSGAIVEQFVAISVRDTGVGMDESTRSRIFEPFFTTKELGKGTGLGLAVVYGVVNSHQGFVDVESAKNVGTTFTLYFPVPADPIQSDAQKQDLPTCEMKGQETILIVEDEEMLAMLLQGILEDQGYKVYTAKDGQEGLDLYQKHHKDITLILSDMGLPRLGGWEMFQEMKKINNNVKAILASGYFDPNLKMDLLKAGAKDFVQKPYVAELILQRIREVIDSN